MKTFRFHGYSDDTFGEYSVTGKDHDNCASGEPIRFVLQHGSESLIVVGQYAPQCAGATWLVGVSAHEDAPLPNWPIRIVPGTDPDYSPVVEIDAPDQAAVTHARERR